MRLFSILIFFAVISCSPRAYISKELSQAEKKFHDHIGFRLYDVKEKKVLADFNAEKYFTPASNTKIFTFYTALQLLSDSVPALKYISKNDSLIFWGLGDPSFLYKNVFGSKRVYAFLSKSKQKLFFSNSNFDTEAFGPGWAWDDFNNDYSPERSPFPVYGNLINIIKKPTNLIVTQPLLFMNHFSIMDSTKNKAGITREIDSNELFFYPYKSNDNVWQVPFNYSTDLLVEMLSDTLKKQVTEINLPLPKDALVFKSIPTDSLYSVMMKVSDNHIAEQLLLMSSSVVSDTLRPDIAIQFAKKNFLKDLPDEPRWVDGSGLSRYNLFTPRSIVKLWEKIYEVVPQDRLFKLLATGGQPGTLASFYQGNKPYVFGKTGSLSNNHCLSGYLVSKKGKVFIFSFMNSNFVVPSRQIRSLMQRVLTTLHDKY